MSWGISGIGKAAALRAKISDDFGRITCPEPEETIKNHVREIMYKALGAFPPNYPVKVEASGSQSHPDFSNKPNETTHSLSVKIESFYGFVE